SPLELAVSCYGRKGVGREGGKGGGALSPRRGEDEPHRGPGEPSPFPVAPAAYRAGGRDGGRCERRRDGSPLVRRDGVTGSRRRAVHRGRVEKPWAAARGGLGHVARAASTLYGRAASDRRRQARPWPRRVDRRRRRLGAPFGQDGPRSLRAAPRAIRLPCGAASFELCGALAAQRRGRDGPPL